MYKKRVESDLERVMVNGRSLHYVSEQTPELCLAAVKQNGEALKYVNEQEPEICLEAIKQSAGAAKYLTCGKAVLSVCYAANPDIINYLPKSRYDGNFKAWLEAKPGIRQLGWICSAGS